MAHLLVDDQRAGGHRKLMQNPDNGLGGCLEILKFQKKSVLNGVQNAVIRRSISDRHLMSN